MPQGSTINHLGGVVRIFANEILFFSSNPPNQIFILFLPNLTEEIFL